MGPILNCENIKKYQKIKPDLSQKSVCTVLQKPSYNRPRNFQLWRSRSTTSKLAADNRAISATTYSLARIKW